MLAGIASDGWPISSIAITAFLQGTTAFLQGKPIERIVIVRTPREPKLIKPGSSEKQFMAMQKQTA